MAPPHFDYHIQGVPRKGAVTVLSHCSEPPLRTSTRLDLSLGARASSSAGLPSLKTSRQIQSLNLGMNTRRSAIRSLANNPNLNVNIVDGRVSVLRRNHGPRGSPTGASSLTRRELPERIVPVSKDGYHPRSRSPTYETLTLAKSQLEMLLSRRLREIRRDFDGQKARQNSAVFSEIMTASHDMEDSWYLNAIDGDDDLSAIETTRLSNEDDATSLETICTSGPIPHRPIKFSSVVLKENICNKAILDMDEKETQVKLEKWQQDHATNIPKLERLESSPIVKRRQCLIDSPELKPTERFLFLRRTSRSVEPAKTKTFKRKAKSVKAKQVIIEESEPHEPEPILPKKVIEEIKPKEPEIPIPVVKDDEIIETRKSLPYVNRPDKEDDIKRDESPKLDEIKNVEPDVVKPLRQHTINQSVKLLNSIDPVPSGVVQNDETDQENQPLTAKEKFLRMQQRMQQRKLQKQKTRDSFADYSFMMYNQSKAGRGGTELNKLGLTLSKRLENMSTFNSTFSDDSDEDAIAEGDQDLQLDLSDSEDDVIV